MAIRIRGALLATLALLLLPLVSSVRAQAPRAQGRAEHVVLVSIDGLRPEFHLDGRWPAPTLQRRAREGTHARAVRGVFPSVTFPSHATMVTGALPARHGILYNTPFEPAGPTGRWYWEASAIRSPALWDALRAAGRSTAAVDWPVSVGAPVTWNLPAVWSLDPAADPIATLRAAATPGLLDELEREAIGRLSAKWFNREEAARDDRLGLAAAYLLETKRPALLLVHLPIVDHVQHAEGRDGAGVPAALGAVDRALGNIVDAARRAGILERTAFVVTGDHGFVDVRTRVAPNVWLAAAGLRDTSRTRGDWRATFHASDAAAFLQLRRPGDADAVARARRAIASQPAEVRRRFRVVERPELDRIGADPAVPFALAAAAGTIFTDLAGGAATSSARGGTHGHFPTDLAAIRTGLVAWGAGVRRGAVIPELALEQVAPLVAALLGVPFDAPDGTVPTGVLAP